MITVVHRSDGSGTTFNFVNYLCKVSPEWKDRRSARARRSPGRPASAARATRASPPMSSASRVPSATSSTPTSLQNKMNWATMQNAAGKFVRPSADSFQAAAASADWANAQDFYLVMTNAPGAERLPDRGDGVHPRLQAAQGRAPAPRPRWTSSATPWRWGQETAKSLDYVPFPGAGRADRSKSLLAAPIIATRSDAAGRGEAM